MGAQAEQYSSAVWRKSSYSANGADCVEIALVDKFVLVRDSHDRSGIVLKLSGQDWRQVVQRIRSSD